MTFFDHKTVDAFIELDASLQGHSGLTKYMMLLAQKLSEFSNCPIRDAEYFSVIQGLRCSVVQ